MRITGNVLGLQGQPKVASPQTSVYPPSVWLKCYLLECMACQVDRWFTKGEEKSPVAAETRGPCDFKDTGDFLSSKHLCVIEALLSRMCRIWQLASCNSHRTSWLASRLDFLQSAGCIHVYSDPVMCILIQYVRNVLTRKVEKWIRFHCMVFWNVELNRQRRFCLRDSCNKYNYTLVFWRLGYAVGWWKRRGPQSVTRLKWSVTPCESHGSHRPQQQDFRKKRRECGLV